ncbi:MAG: alpha/beta fold hydrolase [Actinobacteria bacterium]|nr:MAG: alpha/beta fold hydrolase [Actinomycetota bacterium]
MPEPMELAYEERGSGPVLLFIHGFPFDRTMWIAQLAGLAKIRTAVAVDLRGHGLSDVMSGGDFSMDLFADDVAKTLDAIGAEKADIAGLSMGGYVLFSFWRRHPERVRSLIFIDTKAEADSDEAKAGREKTAETAASQGMQPIYETLASKVVGSSPSVEVQDKLKEMMLGTAPEVAAADALAMRDRADSTADLPNITVPVLWLHGEEDALMPIEGARESAAKIPGASLVSIPKGGHVSPMENPEAVNSAIANFLKTE